MSSWKDVINSFQKGKETVSAHQVEGLGQVDECKVKWAFLHVLGYRALLPALEQEIMQVAEKRTLAC